MRRINPDVKVLLVSGYSLDREFQEIINDGVDGFLQKPFHIETLARKIVEILTGSIST